MLNGVLNPCPMNVNCVTDVAHSSHVCSNTALLCCWWHQRTYTRVTMPRCQGCPVQAYNRNITTSKVNINTLKHTCMCTFTRTQTLTDYMIKLMARLVLLYMRIINVILLFFLSINMYLRIEFHYDCIDGILNAIVKLANPWRALALHGYFASFKGVNS